MIVHCSSTIITSVSTTELKRNSCSPGYTVYLKSVVPGPPSAGLVIHRPLLHLLGALLVPDCPDPAPGLPRAAVHAPGEGGPLSQLRAPDRLGKVNILLSVLIKRSLVHLIGSQDIWIQLRCFCF